MTACVSSVLWTYSLSREVESTDVRVSVCESVDTTWTETVIGDHSVFVPAPLLATARVDAPAATDAADHPILHLNAAIVALLNDPELKVAAP